MTRSVLFVDDEPIVLMSFRRVFRMMGARWTMLSASSGTEAMAVLDAQPVDAVVTDLTMPGMDGAELLRRTMRQQPDAVRFLLSGYSEQEVRGRDLAPAHQFFTKPCDEKRLLSALERAMNARAYVTNTLVLDKIGLPVLPEIARQIAFELDSEAPDIGRIADIVAVDEQMGLALQRFARTCGYGDHDTSRQAVLALGVDAILPVMLFEFVFNRFEFEFVSSYSLPMLRQHCLRTAAIARVIAQDMGLDRHGVDMACAAALLHDAGKLLLDVVYGTECLSIIQTVRSTNRRVSEVEQERLGLTHAEVGAYLLGLLGLPEPMVNAVARHHESEPGHNGLRSEDAVYIANVLDHSQFVINAGYARPVLAPERLAVLGDGQRLERWSSLVRNLDMQCDAA